MKKLMYGGFGILIVIVALATMAAKPNGVTHLTSLWVGDATESSTVTVGENDMYVAGTLEVDDGFYPTSRGIIPLILCAADVDGSGPITTATTPAIAEVDGVPAILWDSSAETTAVRWTIPVPPDYSSGLRLIAMVSSSSASTAPAIDWQLWFHTDNTVFPAAAIAQTGASATLAAVNTSVDILTMTIDSASDSSMSSGKLLTIDVFNGGTSGTTETTELKGLYLDYIRAL